MQNSFRFEDVILTDSYRTSSFKNNLNDHIVSVLDFAAENTNSTVFKDQSLKFSKSLYWECLSVIYEKNPIVIEDSLKEANRILEQNLYIDVIKKLGDFFDPNDELLLETIDFTISNYIDNLNYKKVLETNPWSFTNDILMNDNLLYSFTDNLDEYKNLLNNNKKESESSKYLTIGVLGKGSRKDYSQSSIKDIYALRTLFLNLLDEKNHNCENPIKINDIIKKFRDLGISKDDLSDSNIKYWIVKPLKEKVKIGSNKNGYFIIRNENDLFESYLSHYNNFIGFYKTLERHKKQSSLFTEFDNQFNMHDGFLKDELR
ncbi:hypothetical protein [Flavobacterium sp.]|uniref:hypothetical protein n=1 Tax=Flavobacterium sp. TaxID=239 RepID=UPI00286E7124|nr:hypothetical protein [Flavobacterium sp.]